MWNARESGQAAWRAPGSRRSDSCGRRRGARGDVRATEMARTMEMDRNSEPGAIVAGTEPLSGLAPVTALRGPCAAARSLPCTVGLTAHGAGGPPAGLTATIESREPGAGGSLPSSMAGRMFGVRGCPKCQSLPSSMAASSRMDNTMPQRAATSMQELHALFSFTPSVQRGSAARGCGPPYVFIDGEKHPGCTGAIQRRSCADATSSGRRLRPALLGAMLAADPYGPAFSPRPKREDDARRSVAVSKLSGVRWRRHEGYIHSSGYREASCAR